MNNLPLKPVGGVCGEAEGVCVGAQGAPSANLQVGSIGFGPMWGTEDSMAESIVRISRELEEAQAQCAVYEAERSILIRERDEARNCFKVAMETAETYKRERDEAREKAERYRLEANAMMAQRDEAKRKVAELQAGLDDIEEYGTEEINAAVDLRHQLAAALVECGELKSEKEANHQCLLMLERDIYKAREERDEAREALRSFVKQMRQQAAVFKREDLRDNSRWSIFNEGRAQALEKMADELEAST